MVRKYLKGKGKTLTLSSWRKRNRGENLANWRKKQKTELEIEVQPEVREETEYVIEGRRIVDIDFFIKALRDMDHHSVFGCTFSNMRVVSEAKKGLKSFIRLKCCMCNVEKIVSTSSSSDHLGIGSSSRPSPKDVNTDAVCGVINIGCGYSNMKELFSIIEILVMSNDMFCKERDLIASAWEKTAVIEMELAATEEKKIAIENGDVDKNGIPLLTVIVDGSWAKSSCRTNYSSLSGVAVIIGFYTKKLLYLGVKNKYCTICSRAAADNAPPKQHDCFKNWDGSSSQMESTIIVEGFGKSLEMYGAKYSKMIGDGDSSVFKRILDSRPYDDLVVEKIECKNHLLRNMHNKLKELARNSSYGHTNLRRVIGWNVLRIRTDINCAIKNWKKSTEEMSEKIRNLRKDILNVPLHVFGDHRNCATYFCHEQASAPNVQVSELKDSGLLFRVMEIMQHLADNSKSLVLGMSNNAAETFNSVVAKFIGGKRINYCKKNSYILRCNAAAAAYNSPSPISKLHRVLYNQSPGKIIKKFQTQKLAKTLCNRKYRIKNTKKRLFLPTSNQKDPNYGVHAARPDLSKEIYKEKEENFLKDLNLSDEECEKLQKSTVQQRDSPIWFLERRKRLTASFFGRICRKLPYTSCENIIKSILYDHKDSPELKYGRIHEKDAVAYIKESLNIEVQPCGFFVDKDMPHLGASPDGIIEDGVVEIKCPPSCSKMTAEDAIKNKKFLLFRYNFATNRIEINQKHPFYYQIQGQMAITKRSYCLFVLWTPLGAYTEKISRDDIFWKNEMEGKLRQFYYDCLLPEILDPRYTRSMEIRDPEYIIEARLKRENKRKEDAKGRLSRENKMKERDST